MEKIKYTYPYYQKTDFEEINLNNQTLDVGKAVLESKTINTYGLDKGVYLITTELYYIKGSKTEVVDLSLTLEVY